MMPCQTYIFFNIVIKLSKKLHYDEMLSEEAKLKTIPS